MRMESMVVVWEGMGFDYIGFGGMEGRSSANPAIRLTLRFGLQCFGYLPLAQSTRLTAASRPNELTAPAPWKQLCQCLKHRSRR